jgi:phage baseplate assembly protein W
MAEITIKSNRGFVDLDLNFNVHPTTKDINKFKNENAIINSVKNLVLTNHYERPFQPDLGSNLKRLLFEPVDNATAALLEREITETIENFEPRVQLRDVTASGFPDENGYKVEIVFYLINNPDPVTVDFFLERVR